MIVVPAVPVLSLIVAGVVLVGAIRLDHTGRLSPARMLTLVVVALYAAAVVGVTQFPMHLVLSAYRDHVWPRVNLIPISTIDEPTFSLNVVMMMPLGFLYPLLARSASLVDTVRCGALVSLAIEGAQFAGSLLFDAGRLADVNDVIANTTGAGLGYLVYLTAAHTPGMRRGMRRCALVRPVTVTRPGRSDRSRRSDRSAVPLSRR